MPKRKKNEVDAEAESSDAESSAAEPEAASSSAPGDYSAVSRKTTHKKKKVLVVCSRGITTSNREVVEDLLKMMPHGRKDPKFDKRESLTNLNEVAELAGCKLALYFEARKMQDLYMWTADVERGVSAKFLVEQIKPMGDTRFTGNALLGSRPMLSFDASFGDRPHLQLVRHLFERVFAIPKGHPSSKPFHDHVLSFTVLQGKIVIRHYQVVPPLHDAKKEEDTLVEIGPRLTLTPIKIFSGSFGGETLFANGKYVSPNEERLAKKRDKQRAARGGVAQKTKRREKLANGADQLPADELDDVFDE